MDDFGSSKIFVGVSATPNIATRLVDVFHEFWSWATSWAYETIPEPSLVPSDPDEPDGTASGDPDGAASRAGIPR